MFKALFSPIKIREMELKNRIVLPAMGTKFMDKGKFVTDQLIDYHVARAEGGNGLNMVEVASIHTLSAPRGFVSISEDIYVPGLKKLTEAIQSVDGKAGIQLWQGGLAAGFDQAAQLLLPSPKQISAEITLPGMTIEQIEEVITCYGNAARRAGEAGFDCVEIHAGHNYLLHSFLSAGLNSRTDEYGGSLDNRMRLPLRVIEEVRKNLPEGMPIFMRIVAHDDYLENGLSIEDTIEFCKRAQEKGVDVLDVSRGNILTAGLKFEVPPIDIAKGFNVENASRIRKETGMLTMAVGRINEPELADNIISEGKADFVGIGRGQLVDAEFCNKSKEGKVDEIVKCIGCNQGCYDFFADKSVPHISCLRNPMLGKEAQYKLQQAEDVKDVLIAGGGMAGIELATLLKKRGHNPILCESSEKLGGQFLVAGEAPRKSEMKEAAEHAGYLAKKLGVDIRLNSTVTPDLIKEINPDAFFNATGSTEINLNVPGYDLPIVHMSHNILLGRKEVKGNVVVIGGGLVGLEVAEFLAEKACDVTVLEMQSEVAADLGSIRKICVKESMYMNNIKDMTNAKVVRIEDETVFVEVNGTVEQIPCDAVVVAIGARSKDASQLEKACREIDVPYFKLGDASKARRAIDAIAEAGKLARTFDNPQSINFAKKPNKKVFLTGASGTMGTETMKQFISRADHFDIRILVRPSEKNRVKMAAYRGIPSVEIVWGDMKDEAIISKCVSGMDYVLHVGAMVSPLADKYPKETMETNLGSTHKIINAIKQQPNADEIGLVYIGSIAQTGCRRDPIHWGRCGDPIKTSMFDYYADSKVASERAVFESGLKRFACLRQTGVLPVDRSAGDEPIIFHQNPNNVLEWVTAIESGVLLANICEDWIPESFWRKCYNIGGGKEWRFTHSEFSSKNMEALEIDYKKVYDTRDLGIYNFHGQWYTDSDLLNDITHFRCIKPEQFFGGAAAEINALRANPMIKAQMPSSEQLRAKNDMVALKEMGPKWMFDHDREDWIKAFFGSREKQNDIKSWEEGYELYRPSETPVYLDHGYDESKSTEALDLTDMKGVAKFRGGTCSSDNMITGDLFTPLNWTCAFGHEFEATPNLILKAGHWCPECERETWNYAEIAKVNPFFAQVWTPLHGDSDNVSIKKVVSDLIVTK